jgi:3-hydroxyacyl-CoA dehydrogenase
VLEQRGRGIAQVAASAGHPVMLYDIAKKNTQEAIEFIGKRLDDSFLKGRITENFKALVIKNIKPVNDLDELYESKIILEAVIEDFEIKRDLLCRVESFLGENSILSTNTSSLDLNKISTKLKRPERFVGMHFFNPVPVMALVEIIHTVKTESCVTKFVSKLVKKWGKIPVQVSNSPGFIVNRAARPFYGEPLKILKDGATDASNCDEILRDCGGFRMGPFELMDLIGLDVNFEVTTQVWESFDRHPRFEPSTIQQNLVDAGKYGRKSGQGFYDYSTGKETINLVNLPDCNPPNSIIIEGKELLPESL